MSSVVKERPRLDCGLCESRPCRRRGSQFFHQEDQYGWEEKWDINQINNKPTKSIWTAVLDVLGQNHVPLSAHALLFPSAWSWERPKESWLEGATWMHLAQDPLPASCPPSQRRPFPSHRHRFPHSQHHRGLRFPQDSVPGVRKPHRTRIFWGSR